MMPTVDRLLPQELGDDTSDVSESSDSWVPTQVARPCPVREIETDPRSLCSCAASGDLAGVRLLLAYGVPVNAEVGGDGTALHWAARMGRREVVEELLEAGADVSLTNAQGYTPYAVARDWSPSRDVVHLLEQRCPRRSGACWDR